MTKRGKQFSLTRVDATSKAEGLAQLDPLFAAVQERALRGEL